MLSASEKELIRSFVSILIFNANNGISNISAIMILDTYLSHLCFRDNKITLKQYYRYKNIISKLENYDDQNDIISFKGFLN